MQVRKTEIVLLHPEMILAVIYSMFDGQRFIQVNGVIRKLTDEDVSNISVTINE